MEELSRSIYALESKDLRSAEEEQLLQQLLLRRSDLVDHLKSHPTAVATAAQHPSTDAGVVQAAASQAPAPAQPTPSFLDSVVSSVAEVTHASVILAKSVAGLLVESALDTARLCAPPPPTLEQTLKQLEAPHVPPCVLHMLPGNLSTAHSPQPAVPGDTRELLSNLCEYSLLMDSSVHGRSNKVFHSLCDASGPTLALFLVQNNLFGYFLSKSSGMGIQKAPGSFMFSVFRDGNYRPALYNMLNNDFQVLPSAVVGALPVGWATAKDAAGESYYWCESTRHVQRQSPSIDNQQTKLGPRSVARAAVRARCARCRPDVSRDTCPVAGWARVISSLTLTIRGAPSSSSVSRQRVSNAMP